MTLQLLKISTMQREASELYTSIKQESEKAKQATQKASSRNTKTKHNKIDFMKMTKRLGVYMDHSVAHILDITTGELTASTVESATPHHETDNKTEKGEVHMHNTEKHGDLAYYRKIAAVIKGYDEVVLFGPTKAKDELHNMLKDDHNFAKSDIQVKHADKLTPNQQHAFVREYFRTKL